MPFRSTTLAGLADLAALTLALAACGAETAPETAAPAPAASTGSPAGGASPTASSTAAADAPADASADAAAGAYVSRADYEADPSAFADTAVVYFFHADWCPSCRGTEEAISESGVPAGLTVVKVDYDTETDLRRQYGVTTQHTFVQVDASGAEVRKWTGNADGAAILAETV